MGHDGNTPKETDGFKVSDHGEWNTAQGTTAGVIKKRLTERTKLHDHEVAASPDNPEYLVVSDKTGAEAAHKSRALRKIAM